MLTQEIYRFIHEIMPKHNWFWSTHGQCWFYVENPQKFTWSGPVHLMAFHNYGKSNTIMNVHLDGKEFMKINSTDELAAFLERNDADHPGSIRVEPMITAVQSRKTT